MLKVVIPFLMTFILSSILGGCSNARLRLTGGSVMYIQPSSGFGWVQRGSSNNLVYVVITSKSYQTLRNHVTAMAGVPSIELSVSKNPESLTDPLCGFERDQQGNPLSGNPTTVTIPVDLNWSQDEDMQLVLSLKCAAQGFFDIIPTVVEAYSRSLPLDPVLNYPSMPAPPIVAMTMMSNDVYVNPYIFGVTVPDYTDPLAWKFIENPPLDRPYLKDMPITLGNALFNGSCTDAPQVDLEVEYLSGLLGGAASYFSKNISADSGLCDGSGHFSIPISFNGFTGAPKIHLKLHFSASDEMGDASNSFEVVFDASCPSVGGVEACP